MEAIELTQELIQSKWVELCKSSMEVLTANAEATKFDIVNIQATLITISYNTLFGNQPNNYGNYVALWQSPAGIPWNTKPLNTQNIDTGTPTGTMNFAGLELTGNSYIVGYAVGPELPSVSGRQPQGNMCATALIPAISNGSSKIDLNTFYPKISTTYIGTNSIAINYKLPTGVLPKTNGAWIGLWESALPSYNNPPVAANNLQEDRSLGAGFINNVKILRGRTYTVALFMSGWNTNSNTNDQKPMACYVTFTSK